MKNKCKCSSECKKPIKQHACNKNCIWNPSISSCKCDKHLNNYIKNVKDILIFACEDEIWNYAIIDTSLSTENLYYLFSLITIVIIILCANVTL